MKTQWSPFKKTLLGLTLIYLLLSVSMTISVEKHLSEHGRHSHHAAQHASLICAWMCAASTFVHSADQTLSHRSKISIEKPVILGRPFFDNPFLFFFHIRPPPFSLL